MTAWPRKRRTSASEASTPRQTAPTLETAATTALVFSAAWRSGFVANCRYHSSVNPQSGNVGSSESLNEKSRRIAIGA